MLQIFLICFSVIGFGENSVLSSDRVPRQVKTNNTADDALTEALNGCECVAQYLCDSNNFIIRNGETIIDQRGSDNVQRIVCKGGDYVGQLVCCKLKTDNNTTIFIKEPTPKDSPEEQTTTKKPETAKETTTVVIHPKKRKLDCGVQLPTINVRIFTDENELTSMNGEFPWIAAIFYNRDGEGYVFHCSGSLIHPKVVLTASHCVRRKAASDFKVLVSGEIELKNVSGNSNLERNIEEIIRHPEYDSGGLHNDIALLVLDQPYDISSRKNHINTLCLATKNKIFDNLRCLVAGWGKGSVDGNGKKILKKVELPIVESSRCQDFLRKTRLGAFFELHNSFMCAGGEEGKDACKGDGGSPLMCPTQSGNSYFQVGIVSWGIGCGTVDVPGVYTNVAIFQDWIINELKERQLSL